MDATLSISADISCALQKNVPLKIFTDLKQVFDIITLGKRPTECRLSINVAAAREAYQKMEIDAVGFVRGNKNPADALTKLKHNEALDRILNTHMDNTPVEEWIVRVELVDDDRAKCFDTNKKSVGVLQ